MKNCSLLLLLSYLYAIPMAAASAPKKASYKEAATSPTKGSDPLTLEEDSIASSDFSKKFGTITSPESAIAAYQNIYTRIESLDKALGQKKYGYIPSRKTILAPTLSGIRRQRNYIDSILYRLEAAIAEDLHWNNQESAGIEPIIKPKHLETVLNFRKALTFIDRADLHEEPTTPRTFKTTDDGFTYIDNTHLAQVPAPIRTAIKDKYIVAFNNRKVLLGKELDEFITTLQLDREFVIKHYEEQLKKELPILRKYIFVDLNDEGKKVERKTFSIVEVKSLITHKERSLKAIQELTKNQTDLAHVKEHGACFLKDEKTGDIIALQETTALPGSQAFKAAHSQSIALIMNDEAKKLGNRGIKDSSATELDTISKQIEASTIRKNLLLKDEFENRIELQALEKALTELTARYASLVAIAERTQKDREIQAGANKQMSLNAECTDNETGWLRSLAYSIMTKNAKTPQQVFVEHAMSVATATYQEKLAKYDGRTPKIKEHLKKIGTQVTLENKRKREITTKKEEQETEKAKRLGKRYIAPEKATIVDFADKKYATAEECWELQRPTLEKELKRFLPSSEFSKWQAQQREEKRKAEEATQKEVAAQAQKAAPIEKPAAAAQPTTQSAAPTEPKKTK